MWLRAVSFKLPVIQATSDKNLGVKINGNWEENFKNRDKDL